MTFPDAVFFDMDGVLVDSEQQWRLIEGPFLTSLAPAWREEDHKKIVGLGVADLHRLLVQEYGLKEEHDSFRKRCQKVAEEIYLRRVSQTEGALEIIAELKQHKIPIGLASSSSKEWIDMVLGRFSMRSFFDAVVSADDVGGEGKPSPAIYLYAAKTLRVVPERSIAIEDSWHGAVSAKKAGMICVAFRNGDNDDQDLSLADLEIRRFSELSVKKLQQLFIL